MDEQLKEDIDKLDRIFLSMQRKMRAKLSNELSSGKITLPQFHILSYLVEREKAMMVELARYLRVSASAVTSLVDNLVKMGFLKREFSPADRRVIITSLTAKGRKTVLRIRSQFCKLLENSLEKFTSKERKKLLELIGKMEQLL